MRMKMTAPKSKRRPTAAGKPRRSTRAALRARQNDVIRVVGARENNLQNVTLTIPKRKITVFTGVSGSGKSSLVFDTIAAESQRQLNETFSAFIRHRLPHHGHPDVDALENLSAAIVIDQKRLGGNARSTVGTITDIYTTLRLLYSRLGKPFVGYSNAFSFNDPHGMCLVCEGLGTVVAVDEKKLFDRSKSLNEGAINFPTFGVGTVRWKRYVLSGLFDNDKKLKDYTAAEWQLLLHAEDMPLRTYPEGWPPSSLYQGVIARFKRLYVDRDAKEIRGLYKADFERVVRRGPCPECKGQRLNRAALSCRIQHRNIAECSALQISDLAAVIRAIDAPVAATLVESIVARLQHMISIGLGYLSLDRETSTLSGGESQRVKMVRHLGSSLNDMTYVFDEPSIGLHPRDVHQLNDLICTLRDKGNTILVVEHDPDVIAIADRIVDMGPRAGRHGGKVVYEGTLKGLARSGTVTGRHLFRRAALKRSTREPKGALVIQGATLHNLRDVSVSIPKAVMTVVTGVAGSGKSTLVNRVLPELYPEATLIDQGAISASRRSNPATYTGVLDVIRKRFADANAVSASLFSTNSRGACKECKGLGEVHTDLAFMDPIVTVCEECGGSGFTEQVLRHRLHGKNIREVLDLSVAEARELFAADEEILPALVRLADVGLDYITLGQPLSTLSGGERQRIKLATELEKQSGIYVLDEPTSGLHMSDVQSLVGLLNRLTDAGSTVIVIEHNLDVISQADWIIDMGPGAGRDGGRVVFEGTPAALMRDRRSATGLHLRRYVQGSAVRAGVAAASGRGQRIPESAAQRAEPKLSDPGGVSRAES
jgi:excinuclease UvrABC ATPase subunit